MQVIILVIICSNDCVQWTPWLATGWKKTKDKKQIQKGPNGRTWILHFQVTLHPNERSCRFEECRCSNKQLFAIKFPHQLKRRHYFNTVFTSQLVSVSLMWPKRNSYCIVEFCNLYSGVRVKGFKWVLVVRIFYYALCKKISWDKGAD